MYSRALEAAWRRHGGRRRGFRMMDERDVTRDCVPLRSLLHQHQLARCVAASPSCTFVSPPSHPFCLSSLTMVFPVFCYHPESQAEAEGCPWPPASTPWLSKAVRRAVPCLGYARRRAFRPPHPLCLEVN